MDKRKVCYTQHPSATRRSPVLSKGWEAAGQMWVVGVQVHGTAWQWWQVGEERKGRQQAVSEVAVRAGKESAWGRVGVGGEKEAGRLGRKGGTTREASML